MTARLVCAAARKKAQEAAITYVTGDLADGRAFTAMCAAVAIYLEASKESSAQARAVFPFGPRRGQSLSVGTTQELVALEHYLSATVDAPDKKLFKRANLALRASVLAELHRRHPKGAGG